MSSLRVVSVLLVAVAVAACAARDSESTGDARPVIPAPGQTGTPGCFYARSASDFVVLDRSNLIVYAPTKNNAYHVRISPPSTELRDANALSFGANETRICGYAGDRVLIEGSRDRSYAVIDVARLSPEGLAALLELRAGAPKPVPVPQPGPGAEVEPGAR